VYSQPFYLEAGTYTFSVFFQDGEQLSENPHTVYAYTSDTPFDGDDADDEEITLHTTSEWEGVFVRYYGTFTLSSKQYVRVNVYRSGDYVDFARPMLHAGNTTSAAALLPYNPNLKVAAESSIVQTAQSISLGTQTDIEGKLYSTGINIQGNNRTIDVQADNFNIHNSSSEKVMGVDSYGNMFIKGALMYDTIEWFDASNGSSETNSVTLFDYDYHTGVISPCLSGTIMISGQPGSYRQVLLPHAEMMPGVNIDLIIPARAAGNRILLLVGVTRLSTTGSGDYVSDRIEYNNDVEYGGHSDYFYIPEILSGAYYLTLSQYVNQNRCWGYSYLRLFSASISGRYYWVIKTSTKYGNVSATIDIAHHDGNYGIATFNDGILTEYVD
jgi:hypothetical protein